MLQKCSFDTQQQIVLAENIIFIIIIRKLCNNGNPSAKAAFQGAVLLIIYKLTFQTTN